MTEATVDCRDYRAHQHFHRRQGTGWVCDACEEARLSQRDLTRASGAQPNGSQPTVRGPESAPATHATRPIVARPARQSGDRMAEGDLLRGVLDLCRVLGWRTIHIRPARTAYGWRTPVQGDGEGWPDLFAVRGDRAIAAELKADRGRTTSEQDAWLAALEAAGVETHTWRPADYPDAIAEVLRWPTT